MGCEVFQSGDNMFLVCECCITLQATHRCDAELAHKVWIFAKRLFNASPARVTRNIHHRCKSLVHASGTCVFGNFGINVFDKLRIECGSEADRLRIAGCITGDKPVETLFMEHHGDSEPCLLGEILLHGVGELCHLLRLEAAEPVADAGNLADSVAEVALNARIVELSIRCKERCLRLAPDADCLGNLLFKGHSSQQIEHSLFDGEGWVLVCWATLLLYRFALELFFYHDLVPVG